MARDGYTFPEEVTLVSVDEDSGDEARHTSYAEIVSVSQTETYAAMAAGLRPEFRVVLPNWYDDYHGERRLEYLGIPYRIERAYKAGDLTAELTVTRLQAVSDPDTRL